MATTARAVDTAALARWLATRLDAAQVTITDLRPPSSGFSAETVVFDTTVTDAAGERDQTFVLRREVPDPAVYPTQVPGLDVEVAIQHRCMEALAATGTVPLAPLVGYEDDPDVLGAPFFVMGFVAGDVPAEHPPYTSEGFFRDADPADRRRLVLGGIDQLAALHGLDWRAAGLDWLVAPGTDPGTAHQLELWESYARRELGDRTHPLVDEALGWLHAVGVPDDDRLGFCWGDARPGNIIWQDFTPACVTDFEASHIGSPVQDLAWWLLFDRTMHPDGTRLDGDPDRDEQRAAYGRAAGVDVPDTTWHEVFAGLRYAAIVVRVMNRLEARGDMPAGHDIWLHNPASDALALVLEERP